MEFLFWMIVGMCLGFVVIGNLSRKQKQQEQLADEYIDKALDLYKQFTIPLRCEESSNGFICYNNDTDVFVCQGKNLDEITQNFKLRFPDYGSYIMHESLHLFPEAANKIVDDPSDRELKTKIKEIKKRDQE